MNHAATLDLEQENNALRQRLLQVEETLRAMRSGEVDALYLSSDAGPQIFTLDGADHVYRLLIEEMGQGALTLNADGIVVYANRHYAGLLGRPLSEVIGTRLQDGFAPESHAVLRQWLADAQLSGGNIELDLLSICGVRVPVLLSLRRLQMAELPQALCLVVTDLTSQRRGEAALQAREVLLQVIGAQQSTEESLRQSLATLNLRDNALGAISQGVLIADAQGLITYVNKACEDIAGFTADDMTGQDISVLEGADTNPQTMAQLREAMTAARPYHGELLNYRKDGMPFWNELSVAPVFDGHARLTQFVGVMRDVTARRQAEAQGLLAAQVFEQCSEGFIITDAQGIIIKVNKAFSLISGFSEAEVLGQSPQMLSSGSHDARFFETMWADIHRIGHWEGEVSNRRKDGSTYPQWLSVSRVSDAQGRLTHCVASFTDITLRKAAEESIWRLAHFDALTGLPNRVLLNDRVSQALQAAQRSEAPLTLMFIDLDHFKKVNDSLGHRIGDLLLIALASRMKSVLREQDTLSRHGGDEFVLLLPGTDAGGAAQVAQKLLRACLTPCQIEQHELAITPSIGIALYPSDGADFDTLARCADAAMYRTKSNGRNSYCFYTAEIQARSERALLLENALRRALERGEMLLHYQPLQSLSDGRIIGAEALLRWRHPHMGWVSPAEFIPTAESCGLIGLIGEWVLRSALAQLKQWRDSGMGEMVMAVNLSAVQFRQPNLPELVRQALQDAGVAPHCLELELTESVASEDPAGAVAVMNRLHACGVRMSIDDFGTGYSSLSYLKRFNAYKLKIDQSFVSGVVDSPEDQAIVGTIISLARGLGLRTIAEGVETLAQRDWLRAQGCDEMQGYWLSKPVPAIQFRDFVDRLT